MAGKEIAVKKYVVRLSADEREKLWEFIRSGKRSTQLLTKARILLKADVSEAGEGWSDSRIAKALDTSGANIERTRRQLVEEGCEPACKNGSDAILMRMDESCGRNEASLQKIDLGSSIHLTLDQLEFGDVAFGLTIGPRFDNGGADSCSVLHYACSERGDQARLGLGDPRVEIQRDLFPDHGLEPLHESSGFSKRRGASLDSGNSYGFGLVQLVARYRHQPRDCLGGGSLLQLLIGSSLGTPPSCCPFADHAQGAVEATRS